MVLVAGITASVMIQTMDSLQQQAMQTSQDTIRDISSGLKVTQVSGYVENNSITQLAIFVRPIVASDTIDLTYSVLTLSDSRSKVVLNYSSAVFSRPSPMVFLARLIQVI
jgi:archaellin